jgi:hypothetical protein
MTVNRDQRRYDSVDLVVVSGDLQDNRLQVLDHRLLEPPILTLLLVIGNPTADGLRVKVRCRHLNAGLMAAIVLHDGLMPQMNKR